MRKQKNQKRSKKRIKRRKRGLSSLLMFCALIFLIILAYNFLGGGYNLDDFEVAVVERIIDGDTIVLTNNMRVRLIGIDAPEIGEIGADAATEFVASLIPPGSTIWLEQSGNDMDRFGRLRRYVWINSPEYGNRERNVLNNLLVHYGYAEVLIISD